MRKEKWKKPKHVTVKIPKELIEQMDSLQGKHGFRSRGEIAKEAIRKLLKEYKIPLSPLEHFNIYEDHITIRDNRIGRYIDIFARNGDLWCEYCESQDCEHIRFAVEVPEVEGALRKRGWQYRRGRESNRE